MRRICLMNEKTAIQTELVRQTFSTSNLTQISSVILAAILAFMQRDVIESAVIHAWLFLIVLVALLRAGLAFAYRRSMASGNAAAHSWLARLRFGVLVSGMAWGSSSILLFPANDPQHQMFLIFMLAGLTAGGLVSYSADLVSAIIYNVSVLVPLIIRLFVAEDDLSAAMSLAVTLYLGFMIMSLRYINRNVCENIVLRHEAVASEEAVRTAHRELEKMNFKLNDEKELLEDIVNRMRSASPFDGQKVRHIHKSLEKTAGDIFLSAYRTDGAQHVLVGDFSGHGLPAALGGPLVSYIFYRMTGDGYDMQSILAEVNRTLFRQLPTQLYMAASALEVSPARDQVRVWNYGVPPVLGLNAGHDMVRVNSCGLPLGISESENNFGAHVMFEMQSASRIYQYTDGITEAASTDEKPYGQARLDELVMRICHKQLPLEVVWEELLAYCGGMGLSDDAVMVEVSL